VVEILAPGIVGTGSGDGDQDLHVGVRAPESGCGAMRFHSWPEQPADIHLTRGATLFGVVVDANNKPAPDIFVSVTRMIHEDEPSPNGQVTVKTNAAGRFEIPALFYDLYRVQATVPGSGMCHAQVNLVQSRTMIALVPHEE